MTQDDNSNTIEELQKKLRKLEIRYKQLDNDMFLTREESKENAFKYIETVGELSKKNEELEALKHNLEDMVVNKTAELVKHEKLLAASTEIGTSILATLDDTTEAVTRSLKKIAETFDVDQAYVLERFFECESHEINLTPKYEWRKENVKSIIDSEVFKNPSFYNKFHEWLDQLRDGKSINGIVRNFSKHEREAIIDPNSKSILIVPIMIHGHFWGIVGLNDCRKERIWTENKISILASVGSAIAGAIIRENIKDDLEAAKKTAETAAEEANKATRAKSEFLAHMSHEIRTPLNGVIGMAEILLKTNLDKKQKECVDDLAFSSDLLISIINDILDFSKIEAGKLELEEAPFNLRELIQKLCKTIKYQTEKKGLELHCDYPDNCPESVVGDPVRLRQILINLMSNSVKFTRTGSISIKIKMLKKTESKAILQLTVEDSGIGISKENISKIFDKFTQADSSTTRVYGGTGLGLPISKLLIERMGGEIRVESKQGKGAAFSFDLPFMLSDEKIKQEEENIEFLWNRQPRILLTEDNLVNQKVASSYLADAGCAIDLAENGLDALTQFREHVYDMILMDYQMPLMDGLEATRIIRRMEANKASTPIIALTAGASKAGQDRCFEAGMDDYLAKPLKSRELHRMLAKHLSHLMTSSSDAQDAMGHKAPKKAVDSEPIFDYDDAIEMMNGNKNLLKDLLEYFMNSVPEMLDHLKTACEENDHHTSERLSHTMKGMGANLAAKRFAKTAMRHERASAEKASDKYPKMLAQLRNEYKDFKEAISDFI